MSKRNHTFSGTIRYYLVIGSLFFLSLGTCTEDKPTKPNSKTPNSKTPKSLVFKDSEVEKLFGNGKLDEALRGGYTMFKDEQLKCINAKLAALSTEEKYKLRGKLCIAVQQGTQVTSKDWGRNLLTNATHLINQVYVSACSVSYAGNDKKLWEPLATFVLKAAYEATLRWAFINAPDRPVFLTQVGGGAFGNDMVWVRKAIDYARKEVGRSGLTVYEIDYDKTSHQDLGKDDNTYTNKAGKDWFQALFGCEDTKIKEEYDLIDVGNNSYKMKHKTDPTKVFTMGRFSTPSLAELRERSKGISSASPMNIVKVGKYVSKHQAHSENKGATFQAASQFNGLEFVGPTVTPEEGIQKYVNDTTQGPACAIGCAAGTVFRNYYASVGKDGRLASSAAGSGQTKHNQLSLLKPLLVPLLGGLKE